MFWIKRQHIEQWEVKFCVFTIEILYIDQISSPLYFCWYCWMNFLWSFCRFLLRNTLNTIPKWIFNQFLQLFVNLFCHISFIFQLTNNTTASLYQFYSLWLDPTWAQTYDLPYWRLNIFIFLWLEVFKCIWNYSRLNMLIQYCFYN